MIAELADRDSCLALPLPARLRFCPSSRAHTPTPLPWRPCPVPPTCEGVLGAIEAAQRGETARWQRAAGGDKGEQLAALGLAHALHL